MLKVSIFILSVTLIQAWSRTSAGDPPGDLNALQIKSVTEFVQKQINARSNSIAYSKITSVLQSTKQYVNGWVYKINFEFSQTKCWKNTEITDLNDCPEVKDQVQNCFATVVYPEHGGGPVLGPFNCHSIEKRAGGISEPVSNPEIYMSTLTRAIATSNAALKNVNLVSVRTQVVSGLNIIMKFTADTFNGKRTSCDMKVWSRTWISGEDGFQVKQFDCDQDITDKREKRAGGISEPVSNPEIYMSTLTRAIATSNAALKNVNLVSVRTQVVSGLNIIMKFTADTFNGKRTSCDMKVWSRTWIRGEDGFQVKQFDCDQDITDKREKRAGGISKPVSNPEIYMSTLTRAIATSNAELKNVNLVSVRIQVVSGLNIIMKFTADTFNGKRTSCDMKVWSRTWISGEDGFQVKQFDCDQDITDKRALGGVTGGINDVADANVYRGTMLRALKLSNAMLKNERLVSVSRQVVSGTMIRMIVQGENYKDETATCKINVWNRSWLTGNDAFLVTVFDCDKDVGAKQKDEALTKRANCAGCITEDTDDLDKYMGLYITAYSLAQTNTDINNIRIISVKKQVVAGTKYYMIVETTQSGVPMICDVQFVLTPMQPPDMKLLKFDCAEDLPRQNL